MTEPVKTDKETLVHTHMYLAQSLAQQVWRNAPHALELDEMRAIAYLGLVGAATRWAPYCSERNFSPEALEYFKPFVVRRVRGALMDAIRASDWATRSLRTRSKALIEAGQDRGLSHAELAERTGMSVDEVRSTVRGMAQRPVSLEAEEIDPNSGQNVESTVFTISVLDRMTGVIADLPDEQQTVLALHYHRGLQLQQVAAAMGITETRASHLHARAVLTVHETLIAATRHLEG